MMNQKNMSRCSCGTHNAAKAEAAAIKADACEEKAETRLRRSSTFSEPVCVNSNQVYDSCRDRDCVSNQRVYLTAAGQALVNDAINVKLKSAEVIWVYSNIEPLPFQKGYFSIDLKFFVCCTLEVFTSLNCPTVIHGLTTYDKRVVLYGSEGSSKSFSSRYNPARGEIAKRWQKTDMPTVTVETVDPVALSATIDDSCCCCSCCDFVPDTPVQESENGNCNCGCGCDLFPDDICSCFSDELVVDDNARQVLVTYGLFYLVRLERDTQLLIDAVDFCIPTQECDSASEDDPCNLFHQIRFPVDAFFPPQKKPDSNPCCCR